MGKLRGRIAKPVSEKQSKKIMLRLTPAEYATICQKSEVGGLGLAEYCRRSALSRRIEPKANQEAVRQLSRIGVNINQIAKHYNQGSVAETSLRELVKQLREIMGRL
jgi:hypothetical protein